MKQLIYNVNGLTPIKNISGSVLDTISDSGLHTQNVEIETLSAITGVANGTNVTRAYHTFVGYKPWLNDGSNVRVFDSNGNELSRTISSGYDNVSEVGKYYIMANQYIYFIVPLGTLKAAADALLTGYKIYYQLNTAVTTQLEIMPKLSKYLKRVSYEYDSKYNL